MPRGALILLAVVCAAAVSCGAISGPPPAAPTAGAPAAAAPAAPDAHRVAAARELIEAHARALTEPEIERLAVAIVSEAEANDLDPNLVLAVIVVESRFDPFAISPVGAMGLMQILPSTGVELAARLGIPWRGAQTLFDPFANVRMGVAYLRELSDRFGNLTVALAAYNWGPGHIGRRLRRGTPVPHVYPRLVMQAYSETPRRAPLDSRS